MEFSTPVSNVAAIDKVDLQLGALRVLEPRWLPFGWRLMARRAAETVHEHGTEASMLSFADNASSSFAKQL